MAAHLRQNCVCVLAREHSTLDLAGFKQIHDLSGRGIAWIVVIRADDDGFKFQELIKVIADKFAC